MTRGGARADRLVYAQTWEDPELDLAGLEIGPGDRVATIASGGCTALSFLARGAAHVDAVDTSAWQLATVALKRAAVVALGADAATAFLGGHPSSRSRRRSEWPAVQRALVALGDDAAASHWDRHLDVLTADVLWQGRADRFVAVLRHLLQTVVVGRGAVDALLDADSLEAQARIFDTRWRGLRWRAFFGLLDKRLLDLAFARGAYAHLDPGDWGAQLRERAERSLTTIPMSTNYFAGQLFRGRYPSHPEGRPPYLTEAGAAELRARPDAIDLHEADILTWLDMQPTASLDKLLLSNVDEWLDEGGRARLFAAAARAVRPGGRVTCRALLVARPIPAHPRLRLLEPVSAALAARERAFFNASFRVLEVLP